MKLQLQPVNLALHKLETGRKLYRLYPEVTTSDG